MQSSPALARRDLFRKAEDCFEDNLSTKISQLQKKCGYIDHDSNKFIDELCFAYSEATGRSWENRIITNPISQFSDNQLHYLWITGAKSLRFQRSFNYLSLITGWFKEDTKGCMEICHRELITEIKNQNEGTGFTSIILREFSRRGVAFTPPSSLLPPQPKRLQGKELIAQCEYGLFKKTIDPASWSSFANACGYPKKGDEFDFRVNLSDAFQIKFNEDGRTGVDDLLQTFYDSELEILLRNAKDFPHPTPLWSFFAGRNGWIKPNTRAKHIDVKPDIYAIFSEIRNSNNDMSMQEILLVESQRRSNLKFLEVKDRNDYEVDSSPRKLTLYGISSSTESKRYPILSGIHLVDFALDSAKSGVPETSICVRSGYTIEKIGSFRRAFSKAASVSFGPLKRMMEEYHTANATTDTKGTIFSQAIQAECTIPVNIDREFRVLKTKIRVRDSRFRDTVFDLHGAICACCDFKIQSVLEAAHIVPVSEGGSDEPTNGIPLCPTHHTAFDQHLFCIDPNTQFIICRNDLSPNDLKISSSRTFCSLSKDCLEKRFSLFLSHNSVN